MGPPGPSACLMSEKEVFFPHNTCCLLELSIVDALSSLWQETHPNKYANVHCLPCEWCPFSRNDTRQPTPPSMVIFLGPSKK